MVYCFRLWKVERKLSSPLASQLVAANTWTEDGPDSPSKKRNEGNRRKAMLDVLLGMAVEGVKNLLSSDVGKRAIHLAAHKAGDAAMNMFEHRHDNRQKQQKYYTTCPFCRTQLEIYTPSGKIICAHCGSSFMVRS